MIILLYESILNRLLTESSKSIVDRIVKEMIKSQSETTKNIKYTFQDYYLKRSKQYSDFFSHRKDVGASGEWAKRQRVKYAAFNKFVTDNLQEFARILSGEKIFKFLGSGSLGDVYDLGDKILKIEYVNEWSEKAMTFSSKKRADLSNKSLWDTQDNVAKKVPMIYDEGELNFLNKKYVWIIMEKFETLNKRDITSTFNNMLEEIDFLLEDQKSTDEIMEFFTKNASNFKRFISNFSKKYRLSDDWLYDLINTMRSLKSAGFAGDFHSGNIGIRRSGSQGTLVFFD